jgi:acylphosphatase
VTGNGHVPVRLEAVVRGRVQGVGFRWYVTSVARTLPITGWVANEPDGSVRCIAEGARDDLEQLLDELREGPPGAVVRSVDVAWLPPTGGMDRFGVRSGAHPGD